MRNGFFLYSSISTGHISDRTRNFCALSLYSCNNNISFAFPGTQTCGLGVLWEWVVYDIFTCLVYWWGTIFYDYYLYQSKLLPQQIWNSAIYYYQVSLKQYDCLQARHLWDHKTCLSKSDTSFYDQVCKQMFFDPSTPLL